MMKIIITLSTILVFSIVSSCKKPDTSDLATPGKREFLSSKKWVLSSMTTRSGGFTTTHPLTGCETDDFLLFDASMNYKYDQGACVSNTSAPQTDFGNWQTTDNFNTISFYSSSSSGFYGTYIINELTATTFIFSDNFSSTVTQYTFKAQ